MLAKPTTLAQISELSPELSQAISSLQASKYSQQTNAVNKKQLIDAIKLYSPHQQQAKPSLIADLNP